MSRKRSRGVSGDFKGRWHGDPDEGLPGENQPTLYDTATTIKEETVLAIGQRWASIMEPELGIGTIIALEPKRVSISYQNGECNRQYSSRNAPLKRICFKKGDAIRTRKGKEIIVDTILEEDGILYYASQNEKICEKEISDAILFTAPLERLLAGHHDTIKQFNLRYQALVNNAEISGSPLWGFIGGRIQLLPHQIYLAEKVSAMPRKRILLADEVGLGKTIEACLILHRLVVTGYARRVLILVPESLVHVWFVELLRKFNLSFCIFDQEHINSLPGKGKRTNPFLDEQFVLSTDDFLTSSSAIAQKALKAGWDLVIVDEAHRLQKSSKQFSFIKKLSQQSRDVLFLTATPQQNGEENHFARIHILDPHRYPEYDRFIQESETHKQVARMSGLILDGKTISPKDTELIKKIFKTDAGLVKRILGLQEAGDSGARSQVITELIDRYGTGRVLFRNTRAAIGGFPQRQVNIHRLDASDKTISHCRKEFSQPQSEKQKYDFIDDPRIEQVITLLKRYKRKKFLFICSNREKVKAITAILKTRLTLPLAEFHEELSLLQRDRNAAWFAQDDGARILLCSEIGSEGRNFQFAHHLIMWDLPMNPELIEQRIGRLDRIGQKHKVIIHLLVIKNTPYEILARLFHEGFNIFQKSITGTAEIFAQITPQLVSLLDDENLLQHHRQNCLSDLITFTRRVKKEVQQKLEAGRDRLIEHHSFRPQQAQETVTKIKDIEGDPAFRNFALDLYRAYGIIIEPVNEYIYQLWSATLMEESFPGLSPDRPFITFHRETALVREDIEFITPDHPSVNGGMEMLLGSEKGNCALALWKGKGKPGIFLEAVYVIRCIAPPHLLTARFLPAFPLRIMVDHKLQDRTKVLEQPGFASQLGECTSIPLLESPEVKNTLLPTMQKKTALIANELSNNLIQDALLLMEEKIGGELKRLKTLRSINPSILPEEITCISTEKVHLKEVLSQAKPHLDALRIIWRKGE